MVAPGFRTRMASSLLVLAAALPVSLTAGPALAADRQATPAARPDATLDDFAAIPVLTGEFSTEQYPGRSGGLPDFPGAYDFRDFPDAFLGLSGALPGFPDHPGGPFRHEPRQHHHADPFGLGFPWRSDPVPGLDEGAPDDSADADADVSEPPLPSAPPHAPAPEPTPPPTHRPKPHERTPSASADPSPHTSPAPRPHPARPHDLAVPPTPTPDRQAPTPAPEEDRDSTMAGPDPVASPYPLDAPGARVERVLPMGAGMALTGLGLAFLGLRLRRR